MRRLALVPFVLVLAACPGDKEDVEPAPVAQIDTTPVNFDSLQANIPDAVPDTFKPVPRPRPRNVTRNPYPPAPAALIEVVERQQSFTRFCYQEFGQKADPTLRGAVLVVVSVDGGGIAGANVESDSWTSAAGKAVNRCIVERAPEAWKMPAGQIRAGKYLVPLEFRPA